MDITGLKEELVYFATLYIEDVAEKPDRLLRAQQLVEHQIASILERRGLLESE
jgi:hypothetical protein